MKHVSAQSQNGLEWVETQRVPVVFVSSSAEDAHSLRNLLDGSRWLVVNVPDLNAAQSVIEKMPPWLIVCDTEIEGKGSWRDLLAECSSPSGPAFFVSSRRADKALCNEVLELGGSGVLTRPFAAATVQPVLALFLPGDRDKREAAAHRPLLGAARWLNGH